MATAKKITAPTPLPIVTDSRPSLGCDPEFFFRFKGEVIGAEKFIPKGGIPVGNGGGGGKIIIDGVQAELNPAPNTCREVISSYISRALIELKTQLDKRGEGITADFSQAITISKENLEDLEESSRQFGCAPSISSYETKVDIKSIDPSEYRVRAAGGHIHFGRNSPTHGKTLDSDAKRTVEMLDIICGNTCVLLDRDEANIERRKVYGRAGEYRLPAHGLEYRTLSNFWLTSYQLLSFAFGMGRLAVMLMSDTANRERYYTAFTSAVDLNKIQEAINTNNFELALENFKAIEPLLLQVTNSKDTTAFPLQARNISEFYYFIDKVKTHGLTYWFKEDPMTHWTKSEPRGYGFFEYCLNDVKNDMKEELAKKKAAKKAMLSPTATKGKLTLHF